MSTHNSEPGEIYIDKNKKLWRVLYYCGEPTVTMEELEPEPQPNPALVAQALQAQQQPRTLPLPPRKQICGGVNGLMWDGFRKMEPKEP